MDRGGYEVKTINMTNIESRIKGSEKLTQIFGYWPSFHDAEVMELNLWRGNVNPEKGQYNFPVCTVTLHLWEITDEVDSKGFYVLRNHTLASIRFFDAQELNVEGFNHQNAIARLDIAEEQGSEATRRLFNVRFPAAFGMDASFKCSRIEVVEATRCTERGTACN